MILKENAKHKTEELKNLLQSSGFKTESIILREYNYEFNTVLGKDKIKVQVFFGKKGVKTILQGDNASPLFNQLNSIIFDQKQLELIEQTVAEPDEYIGTDEAGKGDFFGPLVVAAVHVDPRSKEELFSIGVRDSKLINDNQISILAPSIKRIVKENYEVIRINPEKYNELYPRFNNLNKLLNWAHSKAIENLLEKSKSKNVITDKFSKRDLDVASSSKFDDVKFVQETKAEKYTGVAAASILARASFLDWFKLHYKNGYDIPKGASSATETYANKLKSIVGTEQMNKFAKLHFKNFTRLK
ncbi:MAG: ribonuclease HIII [Melioribacteraceae bacterium]|nr:ribonuclease HIII [Melioribacteraceae bacterium]